MENLRLPRALQRDDDGEALSALRAYYGSDGGTGWNGRFFDTWGRNADDQDRFTAEDLISIQFLSVDVPSTTAMTLLEKGVDNPFSDLLARIPVDDDLTSLPEPIGLGHPAWRLWDRLREEDGIEWVVAGKLLARKRPRLIPIYDNVVREVYRAPHGQFWESLRNALQRDDGALARRLRRLHQAAGLDTRVSTIRVLDVVAWMEGKGNLPASTE